jgi:hypothetical protein
MVKGTFWKVSKKLATFGGNFLLEKSSRFLLGGFWVDF